MQNARWRARGLRTPSPCGLVLAVAAFPSAKSRRASRDAARGAPAAAGAPPAAARPARELGRQRGSGKHDHGLLGVSEPRGVAERVAVRAEGARGGVELLDPAVPELAALVDHVVARRAPRCAAASRAGGAWPGSRRPWRAQKMPSALRLEQREVVVCALPHRPSPSPACGSKRGSGPSSSTRRRVARSAAAARRRGAAAGHRSRAQGARRAVRRAAPPPRCPRHRARSARWPPAPRSRARRRAR